MWALIAMFGLNLLQQNAQNKQIKMQNKVAKQNAANENLVRAAQNELGAATGALNRYRQSLSNQTILKNMGVQHDAITENYFRLSEQANSGNLNTRLQAANESGAVTAAASAAGIGGSSVDLLNAQIRGDTARALEAASRTQRQSATDFEKNLAQTTEQGVAALDTTYYLDNVTQVKAIPQGLQAEKSWGDMITGAAMATAGSQVGQQQAINVFSGWGKSAGAAGANINLLNNPAYVKSQL